MKKAILVLSILLVSLGMAFAKDKVIVNPVYEFNKTGLSNIAKIELGKNETRLYVHITYVPHWWVKFSRMTYLEDCATGKRWQATGILFGEFDKQLYMPDSGDSTFVLTFPPLDKSVTKVNYCDDGGGVASIFGISLDAKAKPRSKDIPADVSQWIDGELAEAKQKTMMDFEAGEFFATDTARLIGYINGYDPRAGFSTGIIYARNVATREDYPAVVQIHEDGRFEGAIPMNYPEYLSVRFDRTTINFYIQPGQTLAMLLDWEEFRMANRWQNIRYPFKNVRYKGGAADVNNELFAFNAQLPDYPYSKYYDGKKDKKLNEIKSFYDECLSEYTTAFQRLLGTENLSEHVKAILQNNNQITNAMLLLDYARDYGLKEVEGKPNTFMRVENMPFEFYDFLQNIPMDNKELLSTENFSSFINRFEYCQPFEVSSKIYETMRPKKSYIEYLFNELKIQKTPEDEAFLLMQDSLYYKVYSPDAIAEKREEFLKEYEIASQKFDERHGVAHREAYNKKYVDVLESLTPAEIELKEWRLKDSVYTEVLKLKPGILYDVTKVRSLDGTFGRKLKDNKEAAWNVLTSMAADIPESFLKKEADRLFLKNFPEEQRLAYELPDTYEAKIFKELIAPFKGKFLIVDFWATTCGPCVYNIKQHKALREKYKDSPDVDFVFITAEDESPLGAYNNFVKEQELTHTYRLNADQYRYMRQLFRFNGIPRYVLVDREGNIVDDDYNFRGNADMELKELTER